MLTVSLTLSLFVLPSGQWDGVCPLINTEEKLVCAHEIHSWHTVYIHTADFQIFFKRNGPTVESS